MEKVKMNLYINNSNPITVVDFSLEHKYRELGIDLYVYPDNLEKCKVWKILDPQPQNEIDVEIIESILEEKAGKPIRIEYDCWDQREPGESPYSDSVQLLVAEINYSEEELNEFHKEALELERIYKEKRDKIKLVRRKFSFKDIIKS